MSADGFDSKDTIAQVLAGDAVATALFEAVRRRILAFGDTSVRATVSQIAFRRRRTFAAVWRPDRYLRAARVPLVLTVFLTHCDPSPRWKEIVQPAPGRFTHHLELHAPGEVDAEVERWLREAWSMAA